MEHLTKQQIVLLTLLVSFVTSIATGTVVVSLTDQSSVGVTSTITHLIEKTVGTDSSSVDTSVNASNQASAINAASSINDDVQIPNAIANVQKSIVTIRRVTSSQYSSTASAGDITGLGLIISKDGVMVTDRTAVDAAMLSSDASYIAVLPTGEIFSLQTVQPKHAAPQDASDLVFLALNIPDEQRSALTLKPATLSTKILKLGQNVITLSTANLQSVDMGFIKDLTGVASTSITNIHTSIDTSHLLLGSVLFDSSGSILGIKTSSVAFYPVSFIRAALR